LFFTVASFSQSTDQNLPTAITSNQIDGEIKARDIGDSRLTTYYYIFNGNRGDIFINVVTKNLNGDIDIFSAQGLNPLTKITLFADNSESETGRVVYMRKPEKLILRIQGRSPNDDPATFQIKFAGSFEPLDSVANKNENDFPTINATNQGSVKVNSVGTIIEEPPKPKAEIKTVDSDADIQAKNIENDKKAEIDEKEKIANKDENIAEKDVTDTEDRKEIENKVAETKTEEKTKISKQPEIPATFDPTKKVDDIIKEENAKNNSRIIITDPFKKDDSEVKPEEIKKSEIIDEKPDLTVEFANKPKNTSAVVTIEREPETVINKEEKTEKEISPFAKIFLKVELKNGEKFEISMSEVSSMNVIKGVLTIVTNEGKIREYSILDIVKTIIE
jgi:hypothetical protein